MTPASANTAAAAMRPVRAQGARTVHHLLSPADTCDMIRCSSPDQYASGSDASTGGEYASRMSDTSGSPSESRSALSDASGNLSSSLMSNSSCPSKDHAASAARDADQTLPYRPEFRASLRSQRVY